MSVQSTYTREPAIGFAGQIASTHNQSIARMRNDEASAEMPFGTAVQYGSATDRYSALNLTAITGEVVAGIIVHSHNYSDTQLGTSGVLPDNELNVATQGRILVPCEDGCSPGDRLHIRAVAGGAELPGALRASADGSDTIASTGQGRWVSSAAAGELAWLEFDFTNPLT